MHVSHASSLLLLTYVTFLKIVVLTTILMELRVQGNSVSKSAELQSNGFEFAS